MEELRIKRQDWWHMSYCLLVGFMMITTKIKMMRMSVGKVLRYLEKLENYSQREMFKQ